MANVLLLFVYLNLRLYFDLMAMYISSVSVTLCPKGPTSDLKALVICLDHKSGCTLAHASNFIANNPLVKSYLSKYFISSLNFKYSNL